MSHQELTELEAAAAAELQQLQRVGTLAADSFRLAALEMQLAVRSAAKAMVLAIAAAVGGGVAVVLAAVAAAFTLNALGITWPAALALTASAVVLMCYLAVKRAGKLIRRLTLPQTRDALRAGD